MSLPQQQQHNGTRMRQQIALSMIGLLIVIIWMIIHGHSSSQQRIDKSESGFEHVKKEDEEDFEYSKLGGINTANIVSEQPAEIFGPSAQIYDNNKSDLYIHIGPIQTGVQDIYNTIHTKYQSTLQKDSYTILSNENGNMDGFHEACQHELSLIREKYSTLPEKKLKKMKSLQYAIRELKCWKSVLNTLAPYQPTSDDDVAGGSSSISAVTSFKNESEPSITTTTSKKKQSVLLFDEQLGKQLLPDVYPIGSASLEWITIRDTIMNHFNIIVIVNYRRYYEWLPSAKGYTEQRHLVQHTAAIPRLAKWPGERENGMLLEPLFPHFVHNALNKIDVPYTIRLMDIYRPYVSKIEILNVHIPDQSITTTLLCDVLSSASKACTVSKNQDQQLIQQNPTALSDPFRAIYNTTMEDDWYNFQLYDELVTTAAARGLIRNRRISRTLATNTTKYYVEQYLKIVEPRTTTTTTTTNAKGGIPLTCPNPNDIRHFLDESLSYERTILGRTISQSYAQHHRDSYEAYVNQNMYCSINMRAVLRQVTWRNFFRHLTTLSAPKILAGGKPYPTRKAFLRRW